jgi:protein FAM50
MFSNGYVGTAQDSQRIRRQEKQREEQRKKYEDQQAQQREKVLNAGLKQFGSSKSEAYEAAFKTETVGLVTREEFMNKRNTIQQRLAEEEAREKEATEAAAAAEKERRKREKAKAKLKAKLSFLGDVSLWRCCLACREQHACTLHTV